MQRTSSQDREDTWRQTLRGGRTEREWQEIETRTRDTTILMMIIMPPLGLLFAVAQLIDWSCRRLAAVARTTKNRGE